MTLEDMTRVNKQETEKVMAEYDCLSRYDRDWHKGSFNPNGDELKPPKTLPRNKYKSPVRFLT